MTPKEQLEVDKAVASIRRVNTLQSQREHYLHRLRTERAALGDVEAQLNALLQRKNKLLDHLSFIQQNYKNADRELYAEQHRNHALTTPEQFQALAEALQG